MIASSSKAEPEAFFKPVKSIFVDKVWSGSQVAPAMATLEGKQYIAYYDANRQMTIACRELESDKWTYKRLDDIVGWDSHNYVTLAMDSHGYIHISGNMHGVPLRYYRSTQPRDISTLVRIEAMTDEDEKKCTYPRFGTTPDGRMTFSYRSGGSGNGNEIVNVYDTSTQKWKRLIEKPLFDGEGERNAYHTRPIKDSKGFYHVAWVWRDTPDCSTNHDVSYAKSPNYYDSFQKSDGTALPLPLTLKNSEIIDPIPIKGGLLNSINVSLDSRERVMVNYIKFDASGNTQIYTARREDAGWKIYKTTDWKNRWDFSGAGGIPIMISFGTPSPWKKGTLSQIFKNKYLSPYDQIRFLDEDTLQQIGDSKRLFPVDFDHPANKQTEDWQVNVIGLSMGTLKQHGKVWVLRWESAGANRDKPRDATPLPSKLELIELVQSAK